MNFFKKIWSWNRADLFTPCGLIVRAIWIGAAFLAVHLCGLREHTSVIADTVGSPGMSWQESAFLGVTYLAFYMAAVVLAPILVLAAGFLAVWDRARRGSDTEKVA
jgi:hypothetical protein